MISEQPLYNNDSGIFYKVSVYMYQKTPTIPSNLWGICKLNGDSLLNTVQNTEEL